MLATPTALVLALALGLRPAAEVSTIASASAVARVLAPAPEAPADGAPPTEAPATTEPTPPVVAPTVPEPAATEPTPPTAAPPPDDPSAPLPPADEPPADDDPFGDHADEEPWPDDPQPAAEPEPDTEPLPDYDPLRDSPQALRARHWVHTGIGTMAAGGALLVGSIILGASDPCARPAGNSCQVDARNRAALVMGVPAAILIGGGAAMLGVGLTRQRRLAIDLQASRTSAGVIVRGRF